MPKIANSETANDENSKRTNSQMTKIANSKIANDKNSKQLKSQMTKIAISKTANGENRKRQNQMSKISRKVHTSNHRQNSKYLE